MAVHNRGTIEFPLTTRTTSLSNSVTHTFATETLYIPETTSRVIKSAWIELTVRDSNVATAGRPSITTQSINVTLGAAAASGLSAVPGTYTDTGEQVSLRFIRDVTAYFVANFGAGTSQTCAVTFVFSSTGAHTLGLITGKVFINYEADDAITRIKTVKFPIDGSTGLQTATLTALGANQIPQLTGVGGILPEDSPVIRQAWIEGFGNECSISTASYTYEISVDAGAADATGSFIQACLSSTWIYFISRAAITGASAGAPHAINMRTSTASRMLWAGAVICVTYEYNHTNSTRILNSRRVPFSMPAITEDEPSLFKSEFLIEEPGTITMVQSGLVLSMNQASLAGHTPAVKIGAQSERSYTGTNPTLICGQTTLTQRCDSGGAAGLGMTLARGYNPLQVLVRHIESYNEMVITGGELIINYTSDKHTDGDGVHAKTRTNVVHATLEASGYGWNVDNVFSMPVDANSWLDFTGAKSNLMLGIAIVNMINAAVGTVSGEISGTAFAWLPYGKGNLIRYSAEMGITEAYWESLVPWLRHANDPRFGLATATLRSAKMMTINGSAGFAADMVVFSDYHKMKSTTTGRVVGWTSGDGSGHTVYLSRGDTGECVSKALTTVGGDFSLDNYMTSVETFVSLKPTANPIRIGVAHPVVGLGQDMIRGSL